MSPEIVTTVAAAAIGVACCLAVVVLALRARVKVPPGSALVISGSGAPRVAFGDTLVVPIIARAELIDCTVKPLLVAREGANSLRCRDKLRVDVRAVFQVGINRIAEDVLQVAHTVGAARAADPTALQDRFEAKFGDALATVIGHIDFDALADSRERLQEEVMQVIGRDLGGYVLVDMAFRRLEQVPLDQLDPNNLLDAEAIRRITERIADETRRKLATEAEMAREAAMHRLQARELEIEIERRLEPRP